MRNLIIILFIYSIPFAGTFFVGMDENVKTSSSNIERMKKSGTYLGYNHLLTEEFLMLLY